MRRACPAQSGLDRENLAFLEESCKKGWEGLTAKRADSPYKGTRSTDWLKFKCDRRQEFVIVGSTEPNDKRRGFRAPEPAYHDDGALCSAGRVGTGFDEALPEDLHDRLERPACTEPPLDHPHGDGETTWADPGLVCQAAFTGWTDDGRLRHTRFLGLRRDKDPQDVVRES